MFNVRNDLNLEKWVSVIESKFTKQENENNEGEIYIDAFWPDYLSTFLPKLLYAKGVQDGGRKYKIIVLTTERDKKLKKISSAFDADIKTARNFLCLVPSIVQTLYWLLFYRGKDRIYDISIADERVGGYLADSIIRQTDNLYTVDELKCKDIKKIFAFSWQIKSVSRIFNKMKPDIYLLQEYDYWFGPVAKMAEKKGTVVINCDSHSRVVFLGSRFGVPMNAARQFNFQIKNFLENNKENDYAKLADEYFEKRRQGLTDEAAQDAYANKKFLSRQQWCESVGADKNKKNIVIMAHCFSDAANSSTDRSIYRNYYEWLIETLKIIHGIDNVNWLLKAHPSRGFYREGDGIYKIFESYCDKENIFIVNDDISLNALFEIADGAITVMGTCGLEFSMVGIPVICAGFAAYGGFGFTVEPYTEKEYTEYLANLDKVEKLSKEKIDLSKKISYAYFNMHNSIDEDEEAMNKAYEDSDYSRANDRLIEYYLRKNEEGYELKNTWHYKKGFAYEEEEKRYAKRL